MFEVTNDESLGTFTVSINEIDKPLWFGPFDTGKLAVYNAVFSVQPKIPCYGIIYVMTDEKMDDFRITGYAMYLAKVPKANAVEHLMGVFREHYMNSMIQLRESDGYSLH